MSSAKYKFETNLLQLSESTDINTAKTEWFRIPRETEKGNKLCLCQHRIKNIHYMINTRTNRITTIGKDCLKKFNFGSQTITNSIRVIALNEYIGLGYGKIDDVVDFSEKIEELYLKSVIEKYEMYKSEYDELCNLELEVKQLIDNNYDKLRALHFKITRQISYLNEARQKAEQEQMLEEAKKQAELAERTKQIELERHQKKLEADRLKELEKQELEKQAVELEIRKQQELIENKLKNECKCGIRFENICVCEFPNFEMVKITKQNWCAKCKKWQDRCV